MRKNDTAFTGLQAAIAMIAFVVIATIFAYEILGSGFFASQVSKETIQSGVSQASSSLMPGGDIIGIGTPEGDALGQISIVLALTAGNSPVDISRTTVSYYTPSAYNASIIDGTDLADPVSNPNGQVKWVRIVGAANNLLEKDELVMLTIRLTEGQRPGPDTKITLQVRPPEGAALPITAMTPPYISANEYVQIG